MEGFVSRLGRETGIPVDSGLLERDANVVGVLAFVVACWKDG